MALSVNSVFEIQTGGNDTNGGGFVTGAAGTDYSLVATKRTATGSNDSTTDAVAVGTGVITSVTAAFTSAIVGNIIYLAGGTGTLTGGWYQVITFTSATSITVDRNVAAGTGITINIGGALVSPGQTGGVGLVAGNKVFQKTGAYSITSVTPNVSGGCVSLGAIRVIWEGYQTTRGDLGTAPVLTASGIATITIFNAGNGGSAIKNIVVDGAGLTAIRAFDITSGMGFRLGGLNCTNNAFLIALTALVECYATGCSTNPCFSISSGVTTSCVAYDNTVTAFFCSNSTQVRCIADSNSGASSDGFIVGSSYQVNCIAYNNGRDGYRYVGMSGVAINCIAESNAGVGFNGSGGTNTVLLYRATFSNTGGASSGTIVLEIGIVAGSSSFFVDAANQNFALNNTAGAGASARAAGFPGVLVTGGTGFLDIGALQHGDPASSGSNIFAGEGIGSVITG